MNKNNASQTVETEKFLSSILTLNGLKRGKDFIIKRKQLRIIKNPIRGKVISLIRNTVLSKAIIGRPLMFFDGFNPSKQ